jgi:hypothetical protein
MEREKILNGLRCHAGCERGFDCDNCDYIGNGDCSELLARDALNLLKEQEERIEKLYDEIFHLKRRNREMREEMDALVK